MSIVNKIEDLIGKTPVFSFNEGKSRILVKLECFNPGGSIKDRAALSMIDEAEKSGKLKPGGIIIEPTSGNTGIGLAMIGSARGYRVIIVMPDTMSVERRNLLAIYGAELVLTDGRLRMQGSIEKALELAKTIPDAYVPMQFSNPANPYIHEMTTAKEILSDTKGRIDAFIAGIGTGGTFTGVARALKEKCPGVLCIAVEPSESAVVSGEKPGPHDIQGIGAGFIPENLDCALIDRIIKVPSREAVENMKWMAKKHGLLLGISSGAAIYAAIKLAKELNSESTILCIAPDTGERYLSMLYGSEQ